MQGGRKSLSKSLQIKKIIMRDGTEVFLFSPGNLEGGSCTVPTGLLPLGRLSAES